MKKKVLVIGSQGLVGSRFVELYSQTYHLITPEYPGFDLNNQKQVFNYIQRESPEIIIHLAAYTNVAEAENQRGDKNGECWRVNVEGTKNLVDAVKNPKTRFIFISTDMVFSGSKKDPGAYLEDHNPEEQSSKLTWYGFTKAQAERVVQKVLGAQATILRIIYPVRAKYDLKLDYLRKPLELFDQGKLYPMFADQQVSIAFIDEVAVTLEKIIDGNHTGIFHCSSRDTTTPYELISYLIAKVRGKTGAVQKSSLAEFLKTVDTPVRYPMYGGLKVEKTQKALEIKFSSWKEIVDKLISQGLGE